MLRNWLHRSLVIVLLALAAGAWAEPLPDGALAPGLLAKFSDGERTVAQRVVLPELGLLAERFHPERLEEAFGKVIAAEEKIMGYAAKPLTLEAMLIELKTILPGGR